MLGGCVLLTVETDIAKTDAALLGATTLAMGVLARAYLGEPIGARGAALFWLALGAGILIKGPITPMVAGLTALALVIADRRVRAGSRPLRPLWGVPLMLAVVLPWFVAIGIATHGAVLPRGGRRRSRRQARRRRRRAWRAARATICCCSR